jgi:hypothetical protein
VQWQISESGTFHPYPILTAALGKASAPATRSSLFAMGHWHQSECTRGNLLRTLTPRFGTPISAGT